MYCSKVALTSCMVSCMLSQVRLQTAIKSKHIDFMLDIYRPPEITDICLCSEQPKQGITLGTFFGNEHCLL